MVCLRSSGHRLSESHTGSGLRRSVGSMTLIAADLLLLLLDDEGGKPLVDSTRLPRVLSGAVLMELATEAAIRVADEGESVKKGRLVVEPARRPGDPLLAGAYDVIAGAKPMKPQGAVEKLSKGVKGEVFARVREQGWVAEESEKVLGIFSRTRWPARDASRERAVRDELRNALIEGVEPTPRTAALISLLSAVDAVPKVFPDADRKALKKRAREIAEGDWAGKAVRQAVDAVNAALMTAVMAATVAGTAGSGS